MKNKRSFDSGIVLIALICLTTFVTGAVILVVGRVDNIRTLAESQEIVPVLITIDDEEQNLVSSQLMLINVSAQSAAMLDLPPYLAAVYGDNNLDRVDRPYNRGDIDGYLATVSGLLDFQVNNYLRLPGANLEKIIDLMGGVRMFILGNSDPINAIPSGEVVLDGRKMVNFIDFYSGDVDRDAAIDNLQQFWERFILTISEKSQYLTHATVMRYFSRLVDTNLNRQELSSLFGVVASVRGENYNIWKTQGNLRSVRIDDQRELLLFPYFSGRWLQETLVQIQTNLSESAQERLTGESINVVILNGTDLNGLARRTKLLLEQYGFEVSRIGDAGSTEIENTVIYDHGKKERRVRQSSGDNSSYPY